MAWLVVVSPTTGINAALSGAGYQVVQLRLDAFEAGSGHDVDAFILELESAPRAVAAVARLRRRVALVPVLLVASDQPGWDAPELRELPATQVLPPPVGETALLSALQDLAVEPTPPQRHVVHGALRELTLATPDLLSEDDALDGLINALPSLEAEPAERPRHARGDRSI